MYVSATRYTDLGKQRYPKQLTDFRNIFRVILGPDKILESREYTVGRSHSNRKNKNTFLSTEVYVVVSFNRNSHMYNNYVKNTF